MIGDDLKLWQKAALLLAAPLVLEISVFCAIFNAQSEVYAEQLNERVSSNQLYDSDVHGLKLTLNSISDIYTWHTSGKEWALTRCKRKFAAMKELRERLEREVKGFNGSPLDQVMLETQDALKAAIENPDSDYMDLQIRNLRATTLLLTKAVKASESTHSLLLAEHEKIVQTLDEKQHRFNILLLIAGLSTALFSVCLGLLLQKGTDSQIRTLMENVQRMGRREKLLPTLSGQNELAQIDQTFHSMANAIDSLTERERSVLANSNELILLINEDLKIDLVSASCVNILERSEQELLGLRVGAISSQFVEHLQSVKTKGEERFEIEFSAPGGKLVELEVSASWSPIEKFYYCVGHDIGARKELERMKQSFISMVSHDLRSPISASQAALQLLSSDTDCCKLTDDGTKIVNRMMASNTRLLGMITDLLDMEKLDYGLIGLEYELVTFNDLMYECMTSIEVLATAKGIKLVVDDNDTFIYCDSARLVQVIVNIASNAVKVSKSGTEIEFRFSETEENSIVSVIDHGPGMPADFLPHLFDRYSQVSSNKEVARQGSGLGLAVAKKLVDLHHGAIEVESILKQGTRFDVLIPRRKESVKDVAPTKDNATKDDASKDRESKDQAVQAVQDVQKIDLHSEEDNTKQKIVLSAEKVLIKEDL